MDLHALAKKLSFKIAESKEQEIHEGLVSLGWLPPDEAKALRTQNAELVGALEAGIDAVQSWLDMQECDCPGEGHICGRPLRERQLEQMKTALRNAGEGEG